MQQYKPVCFAYAFVFVLASMSYKVFSERLPPPSGNFTIGHHRFEWTDSSRREKLASDSSLRRIVVEVWYPSENTNGVFVPYLDTVAVNRAFGDKGLQSFVGLQGAALIEGGAVQTYARKNLPFAQQLLTAPVIFFSHGMGMINQLYSTQIQDLASHGYVVVAVSHPHDAWVVSFADGTQIPFETKTRSAAGKTEEQRIAYENERLEEWAADILFALDQLIILNNSKVDIIPFARRLNFDKVGALGHSSGGRAAARACQLDRRIKSCANQDGVAMMQPFYLGLDGLGMEQPFLLFERVSNHIPDEADAASIGMSLQELNALVKRLREDKQAALDATGGSYHVLLHFDSSSHMSFSDLPLLQAKTDEETAAARRVLQVTCRYTREFFDETLHKVNSTLYDGTERLNHIDLVQKYPRQIRKK